MIATIIGAIVIGAIIGALGRLLVPGKQNISIIVTIIIGIIANVARHLDPRRLLGYSNQSGIAWIPLILGAVVAAIDIVIYGRMSAAELAPLIADRPKEPGRPVRPGSFASAPAQDSRPRWYASLTAAARSLTPSFS